MCHSLGRLVLKQVQSILSAKETTGLTGHFIANAQSQKHGTLLNSISGNVSLGVLHNPTDSAEITEKSLLILKSVQG